MSKYGVCLLACLGGVSTVALADVASGPSVGSAVPALTVAAATGEFAGQSLDYALKRDEKPTIYVFIPAEKWSRPSARLIKRLDAQVSAAFPDAAIVAVWLTADLAKTKDYLPKAQQALNFDHTALAAYEGLPAGPDGWSIDTEADLTVVLARQKKITATYGFVSANETLADGVIAALKEPDAN